MALFFSGAVTSSPVKRRLRSNHNCQSLDLSLLSPDSSYVCYSSADGGGACSCRRSPRLLTNGYYAVTEDSFSWDGDGNVSLTPCKTSVSYKENLVRVFRRRRRPRGSLARLLSDVTESCQSWLDEKVFRGVFGTGPVQDRGLDLDRSLDLDQDGDLDWIRRSREGGSLLDESLWPDLNSTELDASRSFTYDPTEVPPPPDKEAPPPMLIQEEICSEICQSKERFTQTLSGLSEVPPPSPFYAGFCRQAPPEPPGLTTKALLLLIFTVFICGALYSGCVWGGVAVATAVLAATAFMGLTRSGPLGGWRRAKTEDITPGNE
ncbi:transmembrane protein 71 [Cololabis saira]|uniref:transmembrane protein 71 n=1 Tax=Cololabis saira TaxID=129043 RepID=UPI002AD2B0D7|nr:transmembrane protein 71 [Cololabis saira]